MEIINNVLINVEEREIIDGVFVIPDNITEIAPFIFKKYDCLKTVIISNSVTTIEQEAFMGVYITKANNIAKQY